MSKQLALSKGYVAIVDDDDFERVAKLKWHAKVKKNTQTVYAATNLKTEAGKYRTERLHRFILSISDPKIEVDHQDHDGLNCRRSNLRPATRSKNCAIRGNALIRHPHNSKA